MTLDSEWGWEAGRLVVKVARTLRVKSKTSGKLKTGRANRGSGWGELELEEGEGEGEAYVGELIEYDNREVRLHISLCPDKDI